MVVQWKDKQNKSDADTWSTRETVVSGKSLEVRPGKVWTEQAGEALFLRSCT